MDEFETEVLRKINNGEKLSEKEIKELVYEYEFDSENGEEGRWTRDVMSIIKLDGRFFAINWEEGLTECQENEFYEQPYEVEKHTYEKTITVTEWNPIKIEKEML